MIKYPSKVINNDSYKKIRNTEAQYVLLNRADKTVYQLRLIGLCILHLKDRVIRKDDLLDAH